MVPPIDPCDFGTPVPCGVNPAFIYTRYPCDYDDPRPGNTRGLPVIVDLRTPVIAEVVNRHRETILAIEGELGIEPSGTYTTVRDRLDAMESVLCTLWQTLAVGMTVKLNGATVVHPVTSLNFISSGCVTVVDSGANQADITITCGGGGGTCGRKPIHEALTVAVPGQTVFTLTDPPSTSLLLLFIDGIKQEIGDYTIVGNQLTWTGAAVLAVTDIVEVFYFIESGAWYDPIHEALPVAAPGQVLFTLSSAADDDLVLLFIGGIKQEMGDYTVVGNQLLWTGGVPLLITDVVEVLYFNITLTASSGTPVHQARIITVNGQVLFTLTEDALNNLLLLFIGGLKQEIGDYTIVGDQLTWTGAVPLITTDVLEVLYFGGVASTCAGGTGVSVADESVIVETDVSIIDFVGPLVTVTNPAPNYVMVTSASLHQEVFTATPGQLAFVVSTAPVNIQHVEMFIDGFSQTVSVDYTLLGSTVTWGGVPPLLGGEVVVIKYWA